MAKAYRDGNVETGPVVQASRHDGPARRIVRRYEKARRSRKRWMSRFLGSVLFGSFELSPKAMKATSSIILGSVILAVFGFGCVGQPRQRLEDNFTAGQVMSAGGRFYMAVDLAPGVNAETATRLLVQSLEGDMKAPATPYPPAEMTLMELRRRDYWALVLSEITGVPIDIRAADPEEEREARIRQLLATMRAMDG